MKTISSYIFLIIFLPYFLFAKPTSVVKDDNSVVQIRSTTQAPNFLQPWRYKTPENRRFYGIHIGDGQILTLSHPIYYATNIEINKHGSLKSYVGTIVKIDHDLGLALLKVDDPDFKNGLQSIQFTNDIYIPSTGLVIEYKEYRNLAERRIRNVKLEVDSYANGYIELPYLEIQSDEKLEGIGELIVEESSRLAIGLLYSFKSSQNSGKLIPGLSINQFIECKKEGSCIPFKGFRFRALQDKASRDYYGIKKDDQGVLIAEVYPSLFQNPALSLQIEDVLLEVAGFKVDPKGFIEHPKFGKVWLSFLIHAMDPNQKKLNYKIPIKILRNRKLMEFDLELKPFEETAIRIPYGNTRGRKPSFALIGGIVFTELSEHYLMEFGNQWRARVSKELLYLNDFHSIQRDLSLGNVIILSQVLPLTGNQSYHSLYQLVLKTVNKQRVKTLRELREIMQAPESNLFHLEFTNGTEVVFTKKEMETLNLESQKIFKIPNTYQD
ncbi:hypothetical protein LPTSP4_33610 [Leptospira ryugenii]|uniref:Protease Do-like PDZ domain-containing protein n=1 Tax=Leptospira ryugenii TaxID=1917863 RepID=A0A2P2E4M1_9LEPT|nr:serine protease [Leptospira ryugenii]GBF51823.1 hypothetical protein LPTSP4_33610 [Leptospira ryugenii]